MCCLPLVFPGGSFIRWYTLAVTAWCFGFAGTPGSELSVDISRVCHFRAIFFFRVIFIMGTPVDLNTATVEELRAIPDIGPKRAARIVSERDEDGYIPMETLERATGKSRYEWIRLYQTGVVTVNLPADQLSLPVVNPPEDKFDRILAQLSALQTGVTNNAATLGALQAQVQSQGAALQNQCAEFKTFCQESDSTVEKKVRSVFEEFASRTRSRHSSSSSSYSSAKKGVVSSARVDALAAHSVSDTKPVIPAIVSPSTKSRPGLTLPGVALDGISPLLSSGDVRDPPPYQDLPTEEGGEKSDGNELFQFIKGVYPKDGFYSRPSGGLADNGFDHQSGSSMSGKLPDDDVEVTPGLVKIRAGELASCVADTLVYPVTTKLQPLDDASNGVLHVAGPKLDEECRRFQVIDPGTILVTGSYGLNTRCVLPLIVADSRQDELLYRSYGLALDKVRELGMTSVAFPLVGCNEPWYTWDESAHLAFTAVGHWLSDMDNGVVLKEVVFYVPTEENARGVWNAARGILRDGVLSDFFVPPDRDGTPDKKPGGNRSGHHGKTGGSDSGMVPQRTAPVDPGKLPRDPPPARAPVHSGPSSVGQGGHGQVGGHHPFTSGHSSSGMGHHSGVHSIPGRSDGGDGRGHSAAGVGRPAGFGSHQPPGRSSGHQMGFSSGSGFDRPRGPFSQPDDFADSSDGGAGHRSRRDQAAGHGSGRRRGLPGGDDSGGRSGRGGGRRGSTSPDSLSRRRRRRSPSTSSSGSCSLLTSEASSSDSEEAPVPGKFVPRKRSPGAPKLDTFKGEPSTWRPFIFYFEQMAKTYRWRGKEKRNRLMACMRGKALEFLSTRDRETRHDYHRLKKALNRRFGYTDTPSSSRKELFFVKQLEGESLEEFAEKVYRLTSRGYQGVDETYVQEFAAEAFLRGCKDKVAALSAADKKPKTLRKAVRMVSSSTNNQKLLGKHHYGSARQVTFEDGKSGGSATIRSQSPVRAGFDPSALAKALARELKDIFPSANRGGDGSGDRRDGAGDKRERSRSRSPSPTACFRCGKRGHFARECPTQAASPGSSPKRECFRCGKPGHFMRDCPERKSGQSPDTSPKA